ncbi:MAG: hypothetical protein HY527_03600 [Betaproteobacteria bacterium]|nr:hypothetical protein [Betaproteobacteria bacterium]
MRKIAYAILLGATIISAVPVHGAEVRIAGNDTIESVLTGQKGRVTLRLRSGQELTGTVRAVTGKLVHLGTLSAREFFDAVVPLEAIEAVIIRTKE